MTYGSGALIILISSLGGSTFVTSCTLHMTINEIGSIGSGSLYPASYVMSSNHSLADHVRYGIGLRYVLLGCSTIFGSDEIIG